MALSYLVIILFFDSFLRSFYVGHPARDFAEPNLKEEKAIEAEYGQEKDDRPEVPHRDGVQQPRLPQIKVTARVSSSTSRGAVHIGKVISQLITTAGSMDVITTPDKLPLSDAFRVVHLFQINVLVLSF